MASSASSVAIAVAVTVAVAVDVAVTVGAQSVLMALLPWECFSLYAADRPHSLSAEGQGKGPLQLLSGVGEGVGGAAGKCCRC